jgi:hypothetical protein
MEKRMGAYMLSKSLQSGYSPVDLQAMMIVILVETKHISAGEVMDQLGNKYPPGAMGVFRRLTESISRIIEDQEFRGVTEEHSLDFLDRFNAGLKDTVAERAGKIRAQQSSPATTAN